MSAHSKASIFIINFFLYPIQVLVLMVGILAERLGKLYAKLDNRNRVRSEDFSASLEAFRSEVSVWLNDLLLVSKPGSDFVSFPWIFRCFQLLPQINDAFAKMVVVEIDHPVTKWGATLAGSYLDYGFRLLGFLNSITYSVSHLGRARLSLSYALCLWEKKSFPLAIKHLRPVELSVPINASGFYATHQEEEEAEKQRFASEKDKIVYEALRDLKGVAFWVCSVISAVLAGNSDLKLETGSSSASGFSSPSLVELDSRISVAISKKNGSLEVAKELNDAVTSLASGETSEAAVKELVKKLEGLENVLEGLRRGVDHLFSKVLAARNELLQGIRLSNK